MASEPGGRCVVLLAGVTTASDQRQRFQVSERHAFRSPVIRCMFKRGSFVEGAERTASLAAMTGETLSDVVEYLERRLSAAPDGRRACRLLLASEFLQLPGLQRLSVRALAARFKHLRSFGSLPTHLIEPILHRLDPLRLAMAEVVLSRDRRQTEIDLLPFWKRLARITPEGGADNARARARAMQLCLERITSLSSSSDDLRDAMTYLAPHVDTFVLRNKSLDVGALVSRLTSVTTLRLDGNDIGTRAGAAVARSLNHGDVGIVDLDVTSCGLTALALRPLASSATATRSTRAVLGLHQRRRSIRLCLSNNAALGDAFFMELDEGCLGALRSLRIAGNAIGVRGAEHLARGLRQGALPSLTSLSAGSCSLQSQGVSVLVSALPVRLAHLDISDNARLDDVQGGTNPGAALSEFLDRSRSTLSELDLGRNEFRTKPLLLVTGALRRCESITTLIMDSMPLEAVIQSLALACQQSRTLTTLSVARARLPARAMVTLAAVVAYSNSLEALDATDNEFDGVYSAALASALQQSRSLTSLTLSGGTFRMPPDAVASIVAGLAHSGRIRSLSFADHALRSPECASIARLIATCPALEFVDLSGNRLTDRGAQHLASVLSDFLHATPSRSVTVDLRRNNIGADGIAALQALSTAHPLVRIVLDTIGIKTIT